MNLKTNELNPDRYRVWLRDLAPAAPSMLQVAKSLEEIDAFAQKQDGFRDVKIYFLRSVTLEPILPFLKYQLYRHGIRAEIELSGFGDPTPLLLDSSSALYQSAPQFVFITYNLENFASELVKNFALLSAEDVQREKTRAIKGIQRIFTELRKRGNFHIFLQDVPEIGHASLGFHDRVAEHSQSEVIAQINSELYQFIKKQKGASIFGLRQWTARVGSDTVRDERLWFTSMLPYKSTLLNDFALELTRHTVPLLAPRKKCLVLDLDQTLWGGILEEDGFDRIQIGATYPGNVFKAFQQELLKLTHRGILLAIASKNNEKEALAVFEKHPEMILRLEHFSSYQINWEDKATNLRRIAKALNIGLDSLVFFDDNPVERALIREMLPEVVVPELPANPLEYVHCLRSLPYFESYSLTEEDRNRTQLYKAQTSREQLLSQATSMEDYYRQLEMEIQFGRADSFTYPRIAQLTQKTNQFNLTTRRYNEKQIEEMANDECFQVYWMRLLDRFGDNGITGVAILQKRDEEVWEIDTFLLSCRILGRTVETAFLKLMMQKLIEGRAVGLLASYLPTAKNEVCKAFYPNHGFKFLSESAKGTLYTLSLTETQTEIANGFKISEQINEIQNR